MPVLWRVVRKDLTRWIRDPVGISLWALIPLAIALLMKLAFGGVGGATVPRAKVAIADADGTLLTRFLEGSFAQGRLAELIETEEADSAEAVSLAREGKVSAAILIPRGFTSDYLDGRTARLSLIKNPSQVILPGIVEEVLNVLADGGFYIRGIFEKPIDLLYAAIRAEGGPADSTVLGISSSIRGSFERVGAYLFPPAVSLDIAAEADEESPPSFLAIFFPGVILMSLLFVGQPLALDLWTEHKSGTYRRTEVAPPGAGGLVLGKTLAGCLLYLILFEILFLVGRYLLRIELARIQLAALFSAIAGFGFLAVLEWIVLLARTENGATILTSLIIMPLVFIGGSFFPFEEMPATLRSIGEHTPNGMVLVQLKSILEGHVHLLPILLTLGVSIAVGLVFVVLAGRRARRVFLGI